MHLLIEKLRQEQFSLANYPWIFFCSSKLYLSIHVYVEQLELLVKLILCTIYIKLFSIKVVPMIVYKREGNEPFQCRMPSEPLGIQDG